MYFSFLEFFSPVRAGVLLDYQLKKGRLDRAGVNFLLVEAITAVDPDDSW